MEQIKNRRNQPYWMLVTRVRAERVYGYGAYLPISMTSLRHGSRLWDSLIRAVLQSDRSSYRGTQMPSKGPGGYHGFMVNPARGDLQS